MTDTTSKPPTLWHVRLYGTNDATVDRLLEGRPWFTVRPMNIHEEDEYLITKYRLTSELGRWLNGGEKPEWIDTLEFRKGSRRIVWSRKHGVRVEAIGPFVEDPNDENSVVEMDEEVANAERFYMVKCLTEGMVPK